MQQSFQQNSYCVLPKEQSYQNDLMLAADFQRAVLPKIIDVDYLNIALIYKPYDSVSGDVYDFILNRERELAIFVGDATGHGISAALMTMMVHIAIDSLKANLSTDESLRKLNRLIASRHTGRSVSSIFLRIAPDGMMKVSHAGHPSIIVIPADNSDLVLFEEAGCALGLFIEEPVKYIEESYQLNSGDKIVAYTDGLIEWRNPFKEAYGSDRLMDFINAHRQLDFESLQQMIYNDVKSFAYHEEINDDLTLLVAEYS